MNKIERLKQNLTPLEYYEKLKYIDFTSINEADRFYLKNFRIYNIKLKPSHFMLRVRGGRYCPLSLWDIKHDLEPKILEFIEKNRISLGFSGCLKGCGRHFHSNIGLIGLRTNLYAPTEKALRVFIGSTQTPKPTPARLLYYSAPKRAINALLFDIFDDFKKSEYSSFEEFSYKVLNRYSIEFLQLWYLLRGANKVKDKDYKIFLKVREEELLNRFEIKSDINRDISNLSHKLWDKK